MDSKRIREINEVIDRIFESNGDGHGAANKLFELVMGEIEPVIRVLIAELVATKELNKR